MLVTEMYRATLRERYDKLEKENLTVEFAGILSDCIDSLENFDRELVLLLNAWMRKTELYKSKQKTHLLSRKCVR